MKTRSSRRVLSLLLTFCLLLCSFSPSFLTVNSATTAIKLEYMGDYVCTDFSNNRLFTLNGTKLYLNNLNYGGGYELYDYADIVPDSTLTLLDAMTVGEKIYTLYKGSEKCYLNVLDVSSLQNFSNTLNFDCEKLFAFENGDIMVSLVNGGSNFVFYLQSNGSYNFFQLSEKIYDFYGSIENKVYYRTSGGIKFAQFSDSAFIQNTQKINNVNNSAYNRVNPFEFIGNNLAASNTGEVYSITNYTNFTKKGTFNRTGYTQSSGALTALVSNSNLILGADGVNKISAYDSTSFGFISSVNTTYKPYLLYTDGHGIICIEKNGDDYYFETFEISDFIEVEAEVINLNNEYVYSDRTKADIAVKYSNALKNADFNQQSLSDEGSLSSPFAGTLMKSEVQSNLIDFSNYLRYLCGLSEYTYGGDSTAVTAGKGAVLLNTVWTRNNITGHTPPRPTDMDEDFYNDAYSVCGGNISYGYGSIFSDQIKAIRALNNDLNNASNYEIDNGGYHQGYNTPGHRNTFLQRGGYKLTYGYADRVLLQYYEYAQSNPNESGTMIETGNNEAAYAWPAPGDFPLEEIDPNAVWSVYFNTDKLDIGHKEPVVTITDLTTGDVYVRNTEMHNADGQREGYATSNFWGKSICFTPPQANSFAGKSYKVTIENLVNNQKLPATVEYTINFFEYKGKYIIDGSEYEMDSYGNMTYISGPTDSSTETPASTEASTAEPTTEAVTTVPVTTEPTEAPTTTEITTEEPTTEPERFLNVHSDSNSFPSADYTIKFSGSGDRFDISYIWDRDITVDSYKWSINFDPSKMSCYTYMTDRGAVNQTSEGSITSTWSNANYPLVFRAGDEFARFSFEALSYGDTTVTFNLDDIIEHQDVVPTTTAEVTTEAPSTVVITTAEPSTAQATTVEITTAEPSTAVITTEPVETTVPGTTTEPKPDYLIGDVNGDGSVDTLDAIIVQKYAAEKTTLNERQLYVGDVNDDGYIDVLDAAMIQKYAVEKLSGFKKK